MKRFIRAIALITVVFLLFPSTAFASAPKTENSQQELREREIMELFDERQQILMNKPVNVAQLNAVDMKLHNLEVSFLSQSEVAEYFPDATESLQGITTSGTEYMGDSVVAPAVVAPVSKDNTWASYRTSNCYYNGNYYNIQRLVAQPMNESSPLWSCGQKNVNYNINWKAGMTTLFTGIVKAGASQLAPYAFTVYDILKDVWNALKPTSDLDISDVTYIWENATTVMFSYVRLSSETDYDQMLSLIATKCSTEVVFVVNVDAWSQNGDGVYVLEPELSPGKKEIQSTPVNYGSLERACYGYVNWSAGPIYDRITQITLSGAESNAVATIYPFLPEYPYDVEY